MSSIVGAVSGRPRITLLTDFGTADGYAAAMRGVIASLKPDLLVDDISHDIRPGDISGAAWALGRYWDHYPEGTVHVVVVDPGVGSGRRGLAVEAAGRFGVGPDNGVLRPMLVAPASRCAHVDRSDLWAVRVAPTFHGRDVFAPVAAHLATSGVLQEVGRIVDDPVVLPAAAAHATGDGLAGAVVHVDRFGNLITNIPGDQVRAGADVRLAGRSAGAVRRTYADAAPGEAVVVTGSSGWLEIAVRDGSAARMFGAGEGTPVTVGLS